MMRPLELATKATKELIEAAVDSAEVNSGESLKLEPEESFHQRKVSSMMVRNK